MKIDLAAQARASGLRRKTVTIRPAILTDAVENDLASILMDSVRQWSKFIRDVLIPNYERPPSMVADADGQQLQWLIDQADRDINNRIIYQTDRLGRWVTKTGEWHGRKTISATKSATGVDIEPYIRLGDVRPLLDRSIADNVSLIKNMNADIRRRVEQIIFDGFARRRTRRDITRDLAKAMGITQRRARFIARDQAHKLQSQLTQYRNEQMGIEEYIWKTRRDERVRSAHRVREGKKFRWDKPPFDGHPGYPVNCRCVSEAVLWSEDDG